MEIKKILSFFMIIIFIFSIEIVLNTNDTIIADTTEQYWESYSVCDGHHGLPMTEWERSLVNSNLNYGTDYATEGWIISDSSIGMVPTASHVDFFVKNSGWDGEYSGDAVIIGDNPYGLRLNANGIKVQPSRYYTIKFNIKSTLAGRVYEYKYDTDGTMIKVDTGKIVYTKAIKLGFLDNNNQIVNDIEIIDVKECSSDGITIVDARKSEGTNVEIKIKIPKDINENTTIKMYFYMGAFLQSRPLEVGMTGTISIDNFEINPGDYDENDFTTVEETTTYTKNDTTKKQNQIISAASLTKSYSSKAFSLNASTSGNGMLTYSSSNTKVAKVANNGKVTMVGYGTTTITIKASGTSLFNSAYKKITVTVKPPKGKIIKAKSPKKAKLTIKWSKDKRATGYVVQFSTNKKFKTGVLQKTFKMKKTFVNLAMPGASGDKYYIRMKVYKKSGGKTLYGAWSKIKKVKIK